MKSIRWGWVLLGGLVAELLIFAIAIPIAIFAGERSLLYTAPTASLIATFVCGCVVAKKATQHQMLHGILVGAAAMVIYVAMSLGRPEPLAYVIAHALKVVGGAAGGYVSLGEGILIR
jgi:putative membrane protein (TIGR04086 family)